MKHTNFNIKGHSTVHRALSTVNRVAMLLTVLLLGTMPMWGEAYTGNLYFVGGACVGQDWTPENAVKMTNEGNGIYTITTTIKSTTEDDGFKFIEARNWDNEWRPTEQQATTTRGSKKVKVLTSNEPNVPFQKKNSDVDTKWQIVTDGDYTYDIRIDLSDQSNGKMSITKSSRYIPIGTFYINGENFPEMNWDNGNQYKMQWDPAKKLWYYYFANLTSGKNYQLKLTKGAWGWELNYNNRDDDKSNIPITSGGSDSRFQFSFGSGTHSATIYTDGEKMWAVADEYANGTFNLSGWNLGRSDHDWKTNGRNMIPLSDGTHVFQQYGVDANTTITFKVNHCGTWNNELNYNHIDNSRSDITLQDNHDNNQIKIESPNYKSDIYFYTDGSKIWVKVYQNGEIPTPACTNCEYLGEE